MKPVCTVVCADADDPTSTNTLDMLEFRLEGAASCFQARVALCLNFVVCVLCGFVTAGRLVALLHYETAKLSLANSGRFCGPGMGLAC